jgi:hypothetical protein
MIFLFVLMSMMLFANIQSSQIEINQKRSEVWRNKFISGQFQKMRPWAYGALSDEQKNNSFFLCENEISVLHKDSECAVMFPLKPCQGIVIKGMVEKWLKKEEFQRRTVCIHKHPSCSQESISNCIQFYFNNPSLTIKKILIYSNKLEEKEYQKNWQKRSGGLTQKEELSNFIGYLIQDLKISSNLVEAYLWENQGILADNIVSFPAQGLMVTHSETQDAEIKSTFPILENYLGNFSSINLVNTGFAWDEVRGLFSDNLSGVYNEVKLNPALSYSELRNKFGNKIDAIIQCYIDKDNQETTNASQNEITHEKV